MCCTHSLHMSLILLWQRRPHPPPSNRGARYLPMAAPRRSHRSFCLHSGGDSWRIWQFISGHSSHNILSAPLLSVGTHRHPFLFSSQATPLRFGINASVHLSMKVNGTGANLLIICLCCTLPDHLPCVVANELGCLQQGYAEMQGPPMSFLLLYPGARTGHFVFFFFSHSTTTNPLSLDSLMKSGS